MRARRCPMCRARHHLSHRSYRRRRLSSRIRCGTVTWTVSARARSQQSCSAHRVKPTASSTHSAPSLMTCIAKHGVMLITQEKALSTVTTASASGSALMDLQELGWSQTDDERLGTDVEPHILDGSPPGAFRTANRSHQRATRRTATTPPWLMVSWSRLSASTTAATTTAMMRTPSAWSTAEAFTSGVCRRRAPVGVTALMHTARLLPLRLLLLHRRRHRHRHLRRRRTCGSGALPR